MPLASSSIVSVQFGNLARRVHERRRAWETNLLIYHGYLWMGNINGVMTTEQADWARLRTLEHMSSLTPQMIFELNATLQDARYSNWRIKRWMMQMQPTEAKLRLRNIPNALPATRSTCIPMATPRAEAVRIQAPLYGEEP